MARKQIDTELLETNFYQMSNSDKMDLNSVRRQLAKAANQRMVRLEKATSDISGNNYAFGAYDIAQEFLSESGRHRFSEGLQLDRDMYDIIREITVLQNFLNSKSSRVGGQRAIEKQRVETFVKAGISSKTAKSKEFYDFLNSETFERLAGKVKTKDATGKVKRTGGVVNSEDLIEKYNKAADEGMKAEDIKAAFEEWQQTASKTGLKGLNKLLKIEGK